MISWLVFPSSPTGNNRRIELLGTDILYGLRVDNVFVYPSDLNVDRLNSALGGTLSLWPLIAGRYLLLDVEHYVIEMSDNGIPVSLVENTQLNKWPLDSNVAHDTAQMSMFLDRVHSEKDACNSADVPLFRLKVTHIVQSGEWALGASWSHVLGDACAFFNFMHALSRSYQQLEPLEPLPVFERRLWDKEKVDQSLLPTMRHFSDSLSVKEYEAFKSEQGKYDQLNLHFSGEQLTGLRELVLDNTVTKHDVMLAYIILTLNIHCFYKNDGQLILRTSTMVNYRGVSDSIAPSNIVGNCSLNVSSDNFDDPYSLSSIARSIRRSIIKSRNPGFLKRWGATADGLIRDMARNGRKPNIAQVANEVLTNSYFRYDWASLVDCGHTDKCRFYTEGTRNLFLRIYRLNPVYDGTEWAKRDREGAEVAFRIEKSVKQNFVDAWQRDVNENFINVKR